MNPFSRFVFLSILMSASPVLAADGHVTPLEDIARLPQPAPSKKNWADRLSIRGYAQLRYSEPKDIALVNENDRSVGNNSGLVLRRARLIVTGEASDLVTIYVQADFGTSVSSTQQFYPQLRDYYADIFFDESKHYRLRAGVSKVPYGFENPQSSQNRLAFDRTDAINTGVKDERDVGLFFYWETVEARARFKELIDHGLKGSGDYGVLAFGVYNGQTLGRQESNNRLFAVARATYPFRLENGQYVEAGVSGYTGDFDVLRSPVTPPTGGDLVKDQRVAAHAIWYPQPFGFQAEYNVGRGPELLGTEINSRPLHGGYVQAMYKVDHFGGEALIPYLRYQTYVGGRKTDINAPRNEIRETELGAEWQASKAIELTLAFNWAHRTTASANLLRAQLQWNY
jgi:hypothetical protein